MALNRVNADSIADGTVIASDIADNTITLAKLQSGLLPTATANSAAAYANSGFGKANTAAVAANTPSHVANSAATYANSGFAVANSAASYANSAFTTSNAAVTLTGTQTLTNKTLTSPTLTTPNIDSAQIATVSGTAPLYMCRAWVNFNGTSTVAIRASGNVTSITDNGTGDYTVNFTNAMPDANYAPVFGGTFNASGTSRDNNIGVRNNVAPTTTALRINVFEPNTGLIDALYCNVAIFR